MRPAAIPLIPLALALAAVTGCADSLLLHPRTHVATPPGAVVQSVAFRDGALEILRSCADPLRPAGAYVLELCGNATVAQDVVTGTARRWRSVNAEVWALNYPGYGGSGGRPRLGTIPAAALAAFDAIRAEAGERPIFVVGRSLGTAAALYVAAHRPVAGLVLHSPTPLTTVILGRFGWWNLWIAASAVALQVPSELDAIPNARHCTVPAVFIITEEDRLVVPAAQRRVVHAYAGPRREVSLWLADHNVGPTSAEEEEIESVIQWLVGVPHDTAR
jgi:predicted esterase